MTEITRVWERLYVGGHNDAEGLAKSNPLGITTVVSLCEQEVIRRSSGVNYRHFPVEDATPLEAASFDAIMDAISDSVRQGSVLLHCGSGMSRAPILVAAWMNVAGYKNIDEALEEIAEARPIITPSKILLASVRRHLKSCEPSPAPETRL